MYRRKINAVYESMAGIFLLGTGILLFQNGFLALQVLFKLTGISILAVGVWNGLRIFLDRLTQKEIPIPLSRIILESGIGCLILFYPSLPISIFGIICGIYFLALAVIHFINYFLARRNREPKRYRSLILTIGYLIIGGLLLFSPSLYTGFVMKLIALYFIFYSFTLLGDAASEFTPPAQKEKLKRRIRFTLPSVVEALIPRIVLQDVNHFLQVSPETENDALPDYSEKKDEADYDLEIFVHITEEGFGAIGHMDLYFDGSCIAYGNYDTSSLHLFETVGDGVLFTAEREKYLPFALKEGKKTLFGFGLRLTEFQKTAVRERLELVKEQTVPWNPPAYRGKTDSYAAKLHHTVPSKFFKFKKGTFRTYFVLGSNCVKLVDYVVGGAGIDRMNGLISPGTYFDYLNKEYASKRMLVVSRQIYR